MNSERASQLAVLLIGAADVVSQVSPLEDVVGEDDAVPSNVGPVVVQERAA